MVTCERIIKDFDPFIKRYGKSLARLPGYDIDDAKQDLSLAVVKTFNQYKDLLDDTTMRRYCASALRWQRRKLYYSYNRTVRRREKFYILYLPIIILWEPEFVDSIALKSALQQFYSELTDTKKEVYRLVMEGYTKKEIAEKLDVSENNVSLRLGNIRGKTWITSTGRMIQSNFCS